MRFSTSARGTVSSFRIPESKFRNSLDGRGFDMRVSSLTLILVAASSVLAAQSQPPPKPPVNNSGQPVRTDNNQGNATPTIAITVTSPEPRPEDKAREQEYRNREVVAQEDISAFTRALTVLAFIQAAITGAALLAAFKESRY
jgi:hypothetical protein